ncbi:alpha/beta fold hydrolase [Nodularia sphaerocarpa]|uniref:alpha/beta fold hydrolase n=1 Tax=Nodularia sphaerocarpa TaxID=137816 RepID=UPI001EFB7357|nr:alpha/beta hydrolase [Nodularia sphaerocarpa]MDB9372187.1 alpha/beta hydrolase [Nodularia sphaerocarpa CS-585]MDB9379111.1 alpha/beta hydrolase [Nodularia sphaerocarpa CS-585A2]ULP72260.1 Putative aminoacrylate hydrolase RutD [Nodularia sphaerocarpa UHCC 0038]
MPKVELKPCFLTPNRVQVDYPLFVYLPGLDGTGELLRSQTAGLEVGFDVRCLAIPRQDLTTWEELSNNVLDLIHAELEKSSHRPVYLCGESFGGCLAMKVATQSPQLFKRIILINPASAFQLRPWLAWTSQFTYFVPEHLYDLGALGLLPFLASLARIPRHLRHELLKTMRSVPPATVTWRLSLLKEFSVTEAQLRQLTQAVLLIVGASDRLLPSVNEANRLLNILPNPKIAILPDSGHACLLEHNINLYEILLNQNFVEHQITASQELETKG